MAVDGTLVEMKVHDAVGTLEMEVHAASGILAAAEVEPGTCRQKRLVCS